MRKYWIWLSLVRYVRDADTKEVKRPHSVRLFFSFSLCVSPNNSQPLTSSWTFMARTTPDCGIKMIWERDPSSRVPLPLGLTWSMFHHWRPLAWPSAGPDGFVLCCLSLYVDHQWILNSQSIDSPRQYCDTRTLKRSSLAAAFAWFCNPRRRRVKEQHQCKTPSS